MFIPVNPMKPNLVNRRDFLKTTVLMTAACTCGGGASAAAGRTGRIPIGLQLYAVRGDFEADVPGTLKAAADCGYKGVEFWGYGGTPNVYKDYTAKQLRQMLDDNGLKCCGMHLELKALEDAQFDRTCENNQILGNRFLIIAGAQQKMASLDGIKSLAQFLDRSEEKARPRKMRVGYHAHGFDFVRHEGRYAWDHLFSQVGPEVIMQMDVGNTLGGGGDPLGMLKKFPGRSLSIHLKEHEDKTFDSPYYREVFEHCETVGKTEWYVVEAGGSNGRGFEVPRQALQALRRVGK